MLRQKTNGPAHAPRRAACFTICNHWSYIGIGWNLGLESCVVSVIDALEIADREPGAKTCINHDAYAYELLAEKFPQVAQRLKTYLQEGKVELIGGSYGQPLGTTVSGESNIRQLVLGRETIRKALGYEVVTFLEEEEFTHPQIPQIAAGAGFRYASLAQLDTWGRAGTPVQDLNVFNWRGMDGTTIPTHPKHPLRWVFSRDPKDVPSAYGYDELPERGNLLILSWEEFGWEPAEEPLYLERPEKYRELADLVDIEFVTLGEYMHKYGGDAEETIYLNMDAWDKLLAWGIGGDQIRILDRKVEGLLLAAERFDAVASALGAETQAERLERAWKNLLAGQSHDVALCEYSRWQGNRMAPPDRIEDYHNLTWGAIGYKHMDAAHQDGRAALDAALGHLVRRIDSATLQQGQLAVTVFNPSGGQRDDVTLTGRIYPLPENTASVVVRDRSGRVVPSQIIKSDKDPEGNMTMADVAFRAEDVPGVGYDTYYIECTPNVAASSQTDLRIDEQELLMENEHLKVRVDAATGAVCSLVDKSSGREVLNAGAGGWPTFSGAGQLEALPANYRHLERIRRGHSVEELTRFDSSQSKAEIEWTEKGPVRATVRAFHRWEVLQFETRVTLSTHSPRVEVVSRILMQVPPVADDAPAPTEIKEGYWLSFTPAFEVRSVVRDFPFGIEPTEKRSGHALTFLDLVGAEAGILLLHPGTQYFKLSDDGTVSNLLVREWESHYSGEYGFPRYAEYRHALMPHGVGFTNEDRVRASAASSNSFITVVSPPSKGDMAPRKGFVSVSPQNVQLSAFRKKPGCGMEIRVVEVAGKTADATIHLDLPFARACETNLLGHKVGDVSRHGNQISFHIKPWQFRTFELT